MKRTEQGQGQICLETKVTLRVKETGKVCGNLILRLFNTDTEEEEDFSGFNIRYPFQLRMCTDINIQHVYYG